MIRVCLFIFKDCRKSSSKLSQPRLADKIPPASQLRCPEYGNDYLRCTHLCIFYASLLYCRLSAPKSHMCTLHNALMDAMVNGAIEALRSIPAADTKLYIIL